ncbi:hypothetical protein [Neobacillus cucumis]|uniref:hypothetical protein n=1 Tax=Neobacillus cucumis TaxID=1740721 RepID=UPI0028535863|nr:hypothetical protein [Neobacillus cucumis]MDR4948104.1 hypothetical protein [Neobacillus cucumis]
MTKSKFDLYMDFHKAKQRFDRLHIEHVKVFKINSEEITMYSLDGFHYYNSIEDIKPSRESKKHFFDELEERRGQVSLDYIMKLRLLTDSMEDDELKEFWKMLNDDGEELKQFWKMLYENFEW